MYINEIMNSHRPALWFGWIWWSDGWPQATNTQWTVVVHKSNYISSVMCACVCVFRYVRKISRHFLYWSVRSTGYPTTRKSNWNRITNTTHWKWMWPCHWISVPVQKAMVIHRTTSYRPSSWSLLSFWYTSFFVWPLRWLIVRRVI